jgi:hypothetical protein
LSVGVATLFVLIGEFEMAKAKQQDGSVSLAQLIANNASLKKHAEVARKTVANRDFNGPPGEYVCSFGGLMCRTKDDVPFVRIQFKVNGGIEGQEDFNGADMGILHYIKDSEYRTANQVLENLMQDLQRMGINTPNLDFDTISKAADALTGEDFTIRYVKKSSSARGYFQIVGPVNSRPEVTEAAADEDGDEWGEEVAEATEDDIPFGEEQEGDDEWDTEEEGSEEYKPSDYLGEEVQWKPPRAKSLVTFTIHDADDEAGTVILSANGKVYGKPVPFDDLTFPEE